MKKVYLLFIIALTLFIIAGCGNGEDTATNDNGSDSADQEEVTENDSKEDGNDSKEADNDSKETENAQVYFKDNEAKLNDLQIKITETKIIPAGEKGNEHGDKPVFAIWYETTNLTEKDINPTTAWMAAFTAIQDNDPNRVNELDVGALPDDRFRDSQLESIKKDGTVEHAIAYKLDDLETPVTLVATQGIMGDKIGEQTFDLK